MISITVVRDALRADLGSAVVESRGFSEGLLRALSLYPSGIPDFVSLSRALEEYLFQALYDRLGYEMTLRLDNGCLRKVHMDELPLLADTALFPLFVSFPVTALYYEPLHAFWMQTGSISAMRALSTRFSRLLPSAERDLMERVVRENPAVFQQDQR